MKTALIYLIGNRDLQVSDAKRKDLPARYTDHLVTNTEGSKDFWIIDKSRKAAKSFLEVSEMMWKEVDFFEAYAHFTLLENTLSIIEEGNEQIDTIFLSTSQQAPMHLQDCYYIAKMMERSLVARGQKCELRLCSYNPTDISLMMGFYIQLYDAVSADFDKVFVGNSGGTPVMRSASHLAGLFRDFEYITLNSEKDSNAQTFKKQEQMILGNIIRSMLKVYDYEGITKLPVLPEITELCKEALNLYNFNVEILTQKDTRFDQKSIRAIELLYDNLRVCFTQGRYADVIGRIFRLEEAIWYLLFYREVQERGLMNEQEKLKRTDSKGKIKYDRTFEEMNAQRIIKEKILLEHYNSLFEEKTIKGRTGWFFTNSNVPLNSGKNFYYFFFKALGKYPAFTAFFAKLNNDYNQQNNELQKLRNKSILGHGFKGVSRTDIESVTGNFDDFLGKLQGFLENDLNMKIADDFNEINRQIERML